MARVDEAAETHRTDFGEMLKRSVVISAAVAAALAAVGTVVALVTDRNVSATIAAMYYIIGCLLFLIGMFPSGGFSLRRGTMTQRRPLGSRLEPTILVGVILVGVGILADVTRPF